MVSGILHITMNTWINFKELREKLDFETVLRDFGVEVKRTGAQHKGPCPLPGHQGERKAAAFSAELERGLFRCFGCGRKGNVLEFAALMDGVDPENGAALRSVAVRLQDKYLKRKGAPSPPQPRVKPAPPPKAETPRVTAVNVPLDFELKGLDPVHPGIKELGFTEETATTFGFGYTDRGSLKGRIAIPLHLGGVEFAQIENAPLGGEADALGQGVIDMALPVLGPDVALEVHGRTLSGLG
jgi:hypothetical protein